MKNVIDKDYKKVFSISQEQYYAKQLPNLEKEILVTLQSPKGGCIGGELFFVWDIVGDREYVRFRCYDDAWAIFDKVPELFALMKEVSSTSSTNSISIHEFANKLKELGYEDVTKRTDDSD